VGIVSTGFKVLSLIALNTSFAHGGTVAHMPVREASVLLYEHLDAHK
jgi:hypothetical protein